MNRSKPCLRRKAAHAVLAVAAVTLVGCGGGSRVADFHPTRILSFGDETSVITADGRKYTVNAVVSGTSTVDCSANLIWVQALAKNYGLVFPQCNPGAVAAPTGRILAVPGAKIADLPAQIDAFVAADRLLDHDLATVLAGANDVVELYRQFPTQSADALVAAAEARGTALADQVNRISLTGARVVVATVLRQGQTPFGVAEQAANPTSNPGRADLLNRLSDRLNAKLRIGLINDGRKIALVLADERISTIVSRPGDFSFVNATQAACLASAAPPACTTQTLTTSSTGTAADGSTWLWANDFNLSAGGQSRFGDAAVAAANNNPF